MIKQVHTPAGIFTVDSETVTDEELAALGVTFWTLFPPTYSTHIGQVVAMVPGAVKPLTLRRSCHGRTYDFEAFVSEALVDLYQAGQLQVGDYIHVDFMEKDPDRALALSKVYKSWA